MVVEKYVREHYNISLVGYFHYITCCAVVYFWDNKNCRKGLK